MDGVGRIQAQHRVGTQPPAIDRPFEHRLSVQQHALGLAAHHLVLQNGGIGAGQVPGLKKRAPVDKARQLRQVKIAEHAPANEFGPHGLVSRPVHHRLVGPGLVERPQRGLPLVGVLLSDLVVVCAQRLNVAGGLFAQQALRHAHAARGIRHIHHRSFVMGRNLDCGMHPAGGGATNQQGRFAAAEVVILLHFTRDIGHLFQTGGDQAGQADDVCAFQLGTRENFMAGHHHPHVDDLVVIALQHHRHNVFADIVHIALDRGNHDLALGLGFSAGLHHRRFFGLDIGQEMRHRLLHDAGTLDHLGQKHLALAKQIPHHIHAVHQRAFDDVQRTPTLGQDGAIGFLGVLGNEVGDAMHQRMAQPLGHSHGLGGRTAPVQPAAFVARRTLGTGGNLHQALTRIGAPVQHHVLYPLAQLRRQVVVNAHHSRVDDAHVHTGLNGVVQKHGVNRLAHRVIAAKRKTDVGDAARHLGAGQIVFDPTRGLDEIHRVIVVFLNAGRDGKDVGVKNDVLGRKPHLIDQNPVGACAYVDLALVGVGLPLLIKGHYHRCRTVAAHQARLLLELLHALLHADGVHDRFALHAAQARFDHAPLAGVNHDRNARNVGLTGDQLQKPHHRGLAIEHGLIHVDVDDLRAVFNLLPRYRQGLLILAIENHAGKGLGAGDVGALANIDEQGVGVDDDWLQAGQHHGRIILRHGAMG